MPQQFLNGIRIDWHDVDDLPSYCGRCPFYFDGSTSTPGVVNETGAKCKKPSATCLKWYDAYKGALIAPWATSNRQPGADVRKNRTTH